MVSHNTCLLLEFSCCWDRVHKGTVCCSASRFFQWHSCPSLDMFVAKVALLHLVVLGAVPTLCVVPWCYGSWLC